MCRVVFNIQNTKEAKIHNEMEQDLCNKSYKTKKNKELKAIDMI